MELPIGEPTPLQVVWQDQITELDKYNQDDLSRVSKIAKQSYEEALMDTDKQLNFQEKLHLEVQVDRARDLIFQCNLELADYLSTIANDNHLENSDRKSEGQDPPESPGLLSKASSDPGAWFKLLTSTLQNFKKTFTLRQVQLTMILFIIEHRNANNFRQIYLKNYGMLPSYIVPVELTSSPINMFILEDLFRKEAEYLKIYKEEILSLKKYTSFEKVQEINQIVGRMKVSHSKIKTIGEIFPWACIKDKNDLFSQPPIDERWQRLTSTGQIKYISLADKHTLSQSFESLKDNLTIVNAAMSVLDKNKKHFSKPITQSMSYIVSTAFQVIKVGLIKSEALREASVMMAQPEEKLAKKIWNLPQNKRLKTFIELSLPSIECSQTLYLPRKLKQYFYERYSNKKEIELPQMHITDKKSYLQKLRQKQSYDETIRIRINCPYTLKVYGDQDKVKEEEKTKDTSQSTYSYLMKSFGSFFQNKKQKVAPKSVVFHIHGGGFISMSSFIHQTYTRIWATKLQVPIVSVDYGKAPEKPFPQGLYDCLEAYMWTLLAFRQIYEINPEQIIIVGDSAGGNLTAALCTLLIEWNLPRPSGLVLVYPALNLNFNTYTPSLLTALNDMILPHTFLKLCLKAYIKELKYNPEEDPFISPILTSSEVLAKYPRTEILVGNKDPFHDDCCRFLEALNKAKKDNAQLTVFEEFPHGFLQFDLKLFPNQYARQATKYVEDAIGFLLAK